MADSAAPPARGRTMVRHSHVTTAASEEALHSNGYSRSDAMRLDELEEMMTEEPSEAEAAIAKLVSSSNVQELARIAKTSRGHSLKLSAIKGLGEVGGDVA